MSVFPLIEERNVSQTPSEAKRAVERILTRANLENEATYAVIFRAVRVCLDAGMKRRETARYLGVSPRRIDRHGQYFRTARSVRSLFKGTLDSPSTYIPADEARRSLIQWAWKS